ncbi:homeobox domain [Encephalitozoon cuniculi GB-M1]|uniref:Homeobox protein HD-5 n=2 Tax=Encephalitozoon cuniculi TaxID=6035 RepID=HD5_ENCCU|nr:homeodomain-containing protein [Encephalitozoon cuniculi GB-M1]Q8SVT3.1 RecName: Full=Homeobox protein HD-5; AltName: Full=EcHD-5 [Encephalitozoon cuniculi GB-M1]ADG08175.1 homeodomain protein class 2 [Encephalitozoon cuniculi]KMV66307.1 homeodomain-containing protein [Encephalitozoon cuniculi EcunIII-L]ADG08176.1 homeodomain protein class 2 [Encephalitozoon cuniculi]ADG08177.1 homeodomain protein class 2 [Encephalitozoon cuniculi]AGE95328.1 homeobox domain containing protein [Encephalitoz
MSIRSKFNKDEKKFVKFIDSTEEIIKHLNKSDSSKRSRLKLSGQQIDVLESNFKIDSHPNSATKSLLSNALSIPLKNIQIWFQNRRAKEKTARDGGRRRSGNAEIEDGEYEHGKMSYQAMCPFDFPPQERYFL